MYTPFNPTFIELLGFAWVYLIVICLIQNIHCGYTLEPPRHSFTLVYRTAKITGGQNISMVC